jgi:hypothetical protein
VPQRKSIQEPAEENLDEQERAAAKGEQAFASKGSNSGLLWKTFHF